MRRLSPREKAIAIFCGSVVVLYAGFLLLRPLSEHEQAINSDILRDLKSLKNNFEVIQKGRTIEGEYKRYIERLMQNDSDAQEMSAIISEIELSANDISMHVSEIKPGKVRRTDFFNNFSVSLSINGELSEITHFLYLLQSDPYYFKIDEIVFEKKTPQDSIINCSLVLRRVLIPG